MKAIKGLVLFCFLAVTVSSCFDPPEFGIAPKISFNKIEFKVTPDPSDADSLILYIDFRDGNGDMGLSTDFRDDPYHERNFYFEDEANNKIKAVGTVIQAVNRPPLPSTIPMIITPPTGKLVTHRTRNKPGFGSLPPFSAANLECRDYTTSYLLIAPPAANAIDASYNITDTLRDNVGNRYYVVKDTVYFKRNPNYYNISVRFFQSSGGPFTEFSWEDQLCTTLNGRFPVLSDKSGPLEGTLRYAMTSTGFTPLFSIRTLKLDIIVKDRALNKDSIRTPEFTLQQIRVN
ncbi:MAG: hypothetical protein KF725_09335 [Cyclobacteriaceae bacterium]|nr:hypothetical protein [Cyclobacteriaceae bacterium]UYN88151.1 MAG: hypothetical protein KIT51_07875 [Cyclobacteriaceae bacterium]